MLHIIKYLIIMLLIPWGELSTVMLWPSQGGSKVEVMINQQASVEKDKEFKNILSGRGKTKDGATHSFHIYKSPDGVAISTRLERRGSSTRAEKELLRNIEAAVEVLEREPKLDEGGRQVGTRAVLTTKQRGSTKLQATVLWTDGSQLYFIESPSLQHALEFEKWYLRNL